MNVLNSQLKSTLGTPHHMEPDFVNKSFSNRQQDKLMRAILFSLPQMKRKSFMGYLSAPSRWCTAETIPSIAVKMFWIHTISEKRLVLPSMLCCHILGNIECFIISCMHRPYFHYENHSCSLFGCSISLPWAGLPLQCKTDGFMASVNSWLSSPSMSQQW